MVINKRQEVKKIHEHIYIYKTNKKDGKTMKRKSIRRWQNKEEIKRKQQGRRQKKKQGSTKSERRTQTTGTKLGQTF